MRGIYAAVSLAVVLVCAPARAESPAEISAKQHFGTAQKLFEHARYAEALDEYQQSYQLSQYPAILYKIALCQDQLGRYREAIDAYKRYLDADPSTDRRAGIEERIAKLDQQLAPAPAPAPPPPEPTPTVAPPPVVEQHAAPVKSETPAYKKWWVWTLVGVGAAGVALGVGLGVGLSHGFSPSLGTYSNAGLRF